MRRRRHAFGILFQSGFEFRSAERVLKKLSRFLNSVVDKYTTTNTVVKLCGDKSRLLLEVISISKKCYQL
jgi:hypothetical protein